MASYSHYSRLRIIWFVNHPSSLEKHSLIRKALADDPQVAERIVIFHRPLANRVSRASSGLLRITSSGGGSGQANFARFSALVIGLALPN
jgi:hypothetical protein